MKGFFFILLIMAGLNTFSQQAEMLQELDPKCFNSDFSSYDPQTALYCGQLSELAYHKKKDIQSFYVQAGAAYPEARLNYTFIEDRKTGAQVLLWCTRDFLVISFRGTEPSVLKDLFTDGKFWNYSNNAAYNTQLANMPAGHGGFRKSLISLITDQNLFGAIDSVIRKSRPDADLSRFPVYLTGHSLGAALSQLFMECLRYKNYNFSGAYHFAPPLAVSCSLVEYMKSNYGKRVYDIVNYKDYIPRAGRNGVAHFGQFYRICNDGMIHQEKSAYVRFSGIEYFKAFSYHKLSNHLSAVRNPDNNTASLSLRSVRAEGCMGDDISYQDPCSGL